MKVGILDWGIGGIDLMLRIRKFSSVNIIYFSDTGFTPYGKVPEAKLKDRVNVVSDFLRENGCEKIIVACNAASTVIEDNESHFGIIDAGIQEVLRNNIKQIGLVGGKRTVDSCIYKKQLEVKGVKVHQVIAQPLSALIEKGILKGDDLNLQVKSIFSDLKNESHILLACTHYKAIENTIKEFIPHVQLIDPIDFLIDKIIDIFKQYEGENKVHYFSTGSIEEMRHTLKIVYQLDVEDIKQIQL